MKPFSTISLQMPLTDPIQGLVLDIEIDTKQTIRMGYFGFQKLKNSKTGNWLAEGLLIQVA